MVNCSLDAPYAEDFIKGLSPVAVCCMVVLFLVSLSTYALFVEIWVFLSRNVYSTVVKDCSLIVLGVFPVITASAQLGMIVPRAAMLANLMTSIYCMTVLYSFFHLMVASLGGESEMLGKIQDLDASLTLPPCCCCCFCLPKIRIDRSIYSLFRIFISQTVFMLPILHFVNAVLWADGKYFRETVDSQSPLFYLGIIMALSTCLCLYVFNVLMKCGSKIADHSCHLLAKYVIIIITVMINGLQPVLADQLTVNGILPCTEDFHWQGRASEFDHMLKVVEAFILMLVSRKYYRKIFTESVRLSFDSLDSGQYAP